MPSQNVQREVPKAGSKPWVPGIYNQNPREVSGR
jgi:hypothetical protein